MVQGRESYTYSGGPVGSGIWSIERHRFQWPKQDFKVAPLFNAEYLRNGTRYRRSVNWI